MIEPQEHQDAQGPRSQPKPTPELDKWFEELPHYPACDIYTEGLCDCGMPHQVRLLLTGLAQDLQAAVPEKIPQDEYKHLTDPNMLQIVAETKAGTNGFNEAIDTTTAAQAAILEKWGLK